MNPSMLYGIRNAYYSAQDFAKAAYKVLGIAIPSALILGCTTSRRPEPVRPLTVLHPTAAQVDLLGRMVRQEQANYAALKRQYDAEMAGAARERRELETKYKGLEQVNADLQQRVEAMTKTQREMSRTQADILHRPLDKILIGKETHSQAYWMLFNSIPWASDGYKTNAASKGTHIYLVHTIGGTYNVYVVYEVTRVGNEAKIKGRTRHHPNKDAYEIPAEKVIQIVPDDVLQQSLDIKFAQPAQIPAQRKPTKKPFRSNEILTMPNWHHSNRRFNIRR